MCKTPKKYYMFRLNSMMLAFLLAVAFTAGCASNRIGMIKTPVSDNISRFNEALYEIFTSIDSLMQGKMPIYLVSAPRESEQSRYVQSVFQEFFRSKNRTISLVDEGFLFKTDEKTGAGYVVTLETRALSVKYSKSEELYKKLSRDISVQVFCTVVNINGRMVVSAQTHENFLRDVVPDNCLNEIQASDFSFAKADLPDISKFRNFFETAAVFIGAGAIVYLLFSTRS